MQPRHCRRHHPRPIALRDRWERQIGGGLRFTRSVAAFASIGGCRGHTLRGLPWRHPS